MDPAMHQLQPRPVMPSAPVPPGEDAESLPASTLVLRLRGLPFAAAEEDVRAFFDPPFPVDPAPGSVVVVSQGFHRGEAYVKFENHETCAAAFVAKNKQNMGGRYIELYASTVGALDLQRQSQEQMMSEKKFYIRLRGLPFAAQEADVRTFLSPVGPANTLSVHMCTGPDGRFNGNAFVELANEDAARQAAGELHRQMMGTRYIEIFESSILERDAVITAERRRRSRMPPEMMPSYGAPTPAAYNPGYGQRPSFPVIRVRGLPFSANESTIAEFLRGVNIPAQGVHMVYNASERPTGEAFVEVYSEADVQASLVLNRQMLGRRYIEVFRSSQGEMQRLQMGDMPPPVPAPAVTPQQAYYTVPPQHAPPQQQQAAMFHPAQQFQYLQSQAPPPPLPYPGPPQPYPGAPYPGAPQPYAPHPYPGAAAQQMHFMPTAAPHPHAFAQPGQQAPQYVFAMPPQPQSHAPPQAAPPSRW